MSKNPYQLKRVTGPGGAPADKIYKPISEAEQREKLVGYVHVPKEAWHLIQFNKHIRYVESAAKGGKFKAGGFVGANSKVLPNGERQIKLKNSLFKNAKNYMEWTVNYSDIEHMYSKMTGVEYALQKDIIAVTNTFMAEITKLKQNR